MIIPVIVGYNLESNPMNITRKIIRNENNKLDLLFIKLPYDMPYQNNIGLKIAFKMFCTLTSKGGRKEVCPVKLKNHSFCPPRNFNNTFKNTPLKHL